MKTSKITIDTLNYFGEIEGNNFNTKVLYTKNGKRYLAHVYIDYFNKRVYIPKQAKECKVLAGFEQVINEHEFKKASYQKPLIEIINTDNKPNIINGIMKTKITFKPSNVHQGHYVYINNEETGLVINLFAYNTINDYKKKIDLIISKL